MPLSILFSGIIIVLFLIIYFADIGKISAIFPAANRMLSRHTLSFASCSFFVFMAISVFSLFSYHWIDFFTSDPSNNIILGELLWVLILNAPPVSRYNDKSSFPDFLNPADSLYSIYLWILFHSHRIFLICLDIVLILPWFFDLLKYLKIYDSYSLCISFSMRLTPYRSIRSKTCMIHPMDYNILLSQSHLSLFQHSDDRLPVLKILTTNLWEHSRQLLLSIKTYLFLLSLLYQFLINLSN